LAPIGGLDPADLAAVWHGLAPPYEALFAWLDGGAAPRADPALAFRPLTQALPFEGEAPDLARGDHAIEALWDGMRVSAAAGAGGRRLYSQAGEDIGAAFPDVLAAMTWHGCVDAVLMIARGDGFAPRADVEARLRRKKPTRKQIDAQPAVLVVHDLLHDGAADLRALPWHARRAALEGWAADLPGDHLRVSPLLSEGWDGVALRRAARVAGEAGVMIKRRDAPYGGAWLAWRRAPLTARCVLMLAARGPLSGGYSELSFGVWVDGPEGRELLPVGKASAPGDARRVDAWVRAHMTERFGPVRGVARELVLEVSFDGFAPAPRRKAGVAMRGAAIGQVLWDASPAEAGALDALLRMDGVDGAGRGRA
jgi:DNA ligase-1